MTEEWRPVVGYEGYYEVSSLGGVRSLSRTDVDTLGRRYVVRGKIKKHTVTHGYPIVRLSRDGVRENVFVHRLVALAFIGSPESGQEACHADGDKLNPCVENLYWGTRADNLADSVRHGTWSNQNVGKTHCKRGHEFTPENTRVRVRRRASGVRENRECQTCVAERANS